MAYASSDDYHATSAQGTHIALKPLCRISIPRRDRPVIHQPVLPCRHAWDAEAERLAADCLHMPPAVQRLCGRWLTWQRLHAGWSTAAVARAAGIRATDLTRLELGRSDTTIFTDSIRTRLGTCLTQARQPHPWMVAVMLGACGVTVAITQQMLTAMAADLASGSAQVPFWHTGSVPRSSVGEPRLPAS